MADLLSGGKRIIRQNRWSNGDMRLQINGLVWMADRDTMLKRIQEKLSDGFKCLKLKIGGIAFHDELELLRSIRENFSPDEVVEWCMTIMKRSPFAIRMIKRGLNAELDGQAGIMELAGDATLMYYLMDEAQEGKNAFLEKRDPDFDQYPMFP